MKRFTMKLEEQFAESTRLEKAIYYSYHVF